MHVIKFIFIILKLIIIISTIETNYKRRKEKKKLVKDLYENNKHSHCLSVESMSVMKKVYKKRFKDNRVFSISGKLHDFPLGLGFRNRWYDRCIDRMRIESAFYPGDVIISIDDEELNELSDTYVEGIVYKDAIYVTRINDFNVLHEVNKLYSLPKVKKNNPSSQDECLLLYFCMAFCLVFLFQLKYGLHPASIIYITLLLSPMLIWQIKINYEHSKLYEVTGAFSLDDSMSMESRTEVGTINGIPIRGFEDNFKNGEISTVHGLIEHSPYFGLHPEIINDCHMHFCLKEKKESLVKSIRIWGIISFVLIFLSVDYVYNYAFGLHKQSILYEFSMSNITSVDFNQLAKLDAGQNIKLSEMKISQSVDKTQLYISDEVYNQSVIEHVSKSIVDSIHKSIVDKNNIVSFNDEDMAQTINAISDIQHKKGEIYHWLNAAKIETASEALLYIDIGYRPHGLNLFTLRDFSQLLVHDLKSFQGEELTYDTLLERVSLLVTNYLNGQEGTLYANVSFVDPDVRKLVVYVYDRQESDSQVGEVLLSCLMYFLFTAFSLFMTGYVMFCYRNAEKRYPKLYRTLPDQV